MKLVIKVSEQCIVYAIYPRPQIPENIIAVRYQMMN